MEKSPKVLAIRLNQWLDGSKISNITVSPELTVPTTNSKKEAVYDLYATVNKHGNESNRGHYTASARVGESSWVHYDDDTATLCKGGFGSGLCTSSSGYGAA